MKKLINQLACLIMLLFISPSFLSGFTVDKEASFKVQKGDLLEVNLRQGNITVNTWNSNEIKVFAKNIDEDETGLLRMEQRSGKVEIEFKGDDSDKFHLELTIPSDLNIDFRTGGGNVKVQSDLNGNIDISTGGGNITTKNLNGKADISTGGGNIYLGDINGDADVSSAGGDLQVGSVNGKADISTAGGNIKVASVNSSADISTAGGNISVETIGGNADISTAGGNINVGNVLGSAEISTAGGNINLDGAAGKVEVNTGAGNINLKNIKGSIDANAGAGNITAELYPSGERGSKLNAGVGKITLYVPESAKTTIIAKASDFKWGESGKNSESIKSDFESFNVSQNRRGNTFESIYELNGGGSRIELNVGMGDIKIKKLD
jgi:hypothetical protein